MQRPRARLQSQSALVVSPASASNTPWAHLRAVRGAHERGLSKTYRKPSARRRAAPASSATSSAAPAFEDVGLGLGEIEAPTPRGILDEAVARDGEDADGLEVGGGSAGVRDAGGSGQLTVIPPR